MSSGELLWFGVGLGLLGLIIVCARLVLLIPARLQLNEALWIFSRTLDRETQAINQLVEQQRLNLDELDRLLEPYRRLRRLARRPLVAALVRWAVGSRP